MESVEYINGYGQSLTLISGVPPFVLQTIEGTGGVPVDVQTKKSPYQDGESYINTNIKPRPIPIHVAIMGNNDQHLKQLRAQMLRVFNPKAGIGILRYTFGGSTLEIEAVVDTPPVFASGSANRGYGFQIALVELLCPDPYWYDPTEVSLALTGFTGGLELPFSFPLQFGDVGTEITIENNGDVEAPVTLQIYGGMSSLVLENLTTGQSITFVQAVDAGEHLEINTADGKKYVEKILADGTRDNAFNYIDPDSTFIKIIPGENLMRYTATDLTEGSMVYLSYKHRYSGV